MVRYRSAILHILLAMLLVAFVFQGAIASCAIAETATDAYDKDAPQDLESEHLSSSSAVLIDAKSGTVLFEKNPDAKMYPASTTKVMTLLLGIEYAHWDDQVTIPQEAANIPIDSSLVPVDVGEKIIYRDLLYGFMLRSGNEAANAIAVIVAGSVDAFVDMMNDRAKQLGLENTHYANAHGYYNENHYTSVRDMAVLTQEAMKNSLFREIVSTYEYTLPLTNMHDARKITSTDQMINPDSQFYNSFSIGIKTGYTSQAGHCFIGASLKDGKELISVVFNTTQNGRWTDTQRLFDYGYTRYEKYTFSELYALASISVQVSNYHQDDANDGFVNLVPIPSGGANDYSVICLPDEFDEMLDDFKKRLNVSYTRELAAPISQGDILGTLSITQDDGETLTTTVIAGRDVAEAPPKFSLIDYVPQLEEINVNFVKFILILFVLLVIIFFFLYLRASLRRRRRRKEAMRRRREMQSQRQRYYPYD